MGGGACKSPPESVPAAGRKDTSQGSQSSSVGDPQRSRRQDHSVGAVNDIHSILHPSWAMQRKLSQKGQGLD